MKYSLYYDRLIARARSRKLPPELYFERHHVVPKCLGGSNRKDNIVRLTAKEHQCAHLLLVKIYLDASPKVRQGLACAAAMMAGTRFEWARRIHAASIAAQPSNHPRRIASKNMMTARWADPEYRLLQSARLSALNDSPEKKKHQLEVIAKRFSDPAQRAAQSEVMRLVNIGRRGKAMAPETKRKIAESMRVARAANPWSTRKVIKNGLCPL